MMARTSDDDAWLELHDHLREDILRHVCSQRLWSGHDVHGTLRAIAWTSKANHALVKGLPFRKLRMLVGECYTCDRRLPSAMTPELYVWKSKQTITRVSFTGIRFTREDLHTSPLKDVPNLRRVDIQGCMFDSTTVMTNLLLPVAGKLTHLDLDGSRCSSYPYAILSHKVVALMQHLEFLDISDQIVDAAFVKALIEGPAATLKTLRMQAIAEKHWMAMAMACDHLEDLRIATIYMVRTRYRRVSYSDKHVLYPFLRVSSLSSLRALELGRCSMIRVQDLKDLTALTRLEMTVCNFKPPAMENVHWDPRIDETYPFPPLRSLDLTINYDEKQCHASINAFLARAAPGLSTCRLTCYRDRLTPLQFVGIDVLDNAPTYGLITRHDIRAEDVERFSCFLRLTRLQFVPSSSNVLDMIGTTCTRLVELNLQYNARVLTPSAAGLELGTPSPVWSRLETFTFRFVSRFYHNRHDDVDSPSDEESVDSFELHDLIDEAAFDEDHMLPPHGHDDHDLEEPFRGICVSLIPWMRCMTSLKTVHLDLAREVMTDFRDVDVLFSTLPPGLEQLAVDVFINRIECAQDFATLIVAKFKQLRSLTVTGTMSPDANKAFEGVLRAGMPFLVVQHARVNVY
jgi:hypothetical protein